jgi:hypothetical protein
MTMLFHLETSLIVLIAGVLLCVLATDISSAAAAVVPPETAPSEEEVVPSEIPPEAEFREPLKDPFQESRNPDPYETIRRKREKRTLYIILGVVVLLCAYWLSSGRLHHRLPR